MSTAARSFSATPTTRAAGKRSLSRSPRKIAVERSGEARRSRVFGAAAAEDRTSRLRILGAVHRASEHRVEPAIPDDAVVARVEARADRGVPGSRERHRVALGGVREDGALAQETVEAPLAEPGAKALEVVGPHLVDGDHENERRLLGGPPTERGGDDERRRGGRRGEARTVIGGFWHRENEARMSIATMRSEIRLASCSRRCLPAAAGDRRSRARDARSRRPRGERARRRRGHGAISPPTTATRPATAARTSRRRCAGTSPPTRSSG